MAELHRRPARILRVAAICSAAAMLGACVGPAPIAGPADAVGYCYRTLALVDCYTTPEINRPTIVPATYRGE